MLVFVKVSFSGLNSLLIILFLSVTYYSSYESAECKLLILIYISRCQGLGLALESPSACAIKDSATVCGSSEFVRNQLRWRTSKQSARL